MGKIEEEKELRGGKGREGEIWRKLKKLSCLADMGMKLTLRKNKMFGKKKMLLVKWEGEVKYP